MHAIAPPSPQPLTNVVRRSSTTHMADECLLRRLFSTLGIAQPDDTRTFLQAESAPESESQDPEIISNEELLGLTCDGGGRAWGSTQMIAYSPPCKRSRKRTALSAFKFPNIDVIFPSQVTVFPDPLNGELYPFPKYEDTCSEVTTSVKEYDTLRREMQEVKMTIKKLEMCFPGDNPGIIAATHDLAAAYLSLRQYREAEKHFNRILPMLIQRHGSSSCYVTSVRIDLSDVMSRLGRYTEANQLAQEAHTAALGVDDPGGHLTQASIQVLARSFGNLGDLKQEEKLLRQLVQITLAQYGPKYGESLAAIRDLSRHMMDSKNYCDSEELLRVAIELSHKTHRISDRQNCFYMRQLAKVLYMQGKYTESEALCRTTMETSEQLLGDCHPDTLRCKFWFSKVLKTQSKLNDSQQILEQTVEKLIETRGELTSSTIEAMADLGKLLLQMEKVEEAEMWIHRALRCGRQNCSGGSEDMYMKRICDDLERLCERQVWAA